MILTSALFVDDQAGVLTSGLVCHLRLIQQLFANLGDLDGGHLAVLGRRHHNLLCNMPQGSRLNFLQTSEEVEAALRKVRAQILN